MLKSNQRITEVVFLGGNGNKSARCIQGTSSLELLLGIWLFYPFVVTCSEIQ